MIPAPTSFTLSHGTLEASSSPFHGPQVIADLLPELGLPVFGRWSEVDGEGGPTASGVNGGPAASGVDSAEGYRLRVSEEGLEVQGRLAGLRWAVQTLRALMPGNSLPHMEIVDSPRYPWRGSLLDVARWCLPIEFLHRYVDLLALHKLNRLHLHLTDDQGWRFESKRHPRLHQVGGFRHRTMKGHFYNFSFDDEPHGGFYTQEQLKNLVAYARRRGVEIMPEIDLPGHTQAAIAAYPELGNHPDRTVEVSQRWGIHDMVLNTRDETVAFFRDVLDEVVDVFPFEYVHLGGDEVRSAQWRDSAEALRRAESLGLSKVEDLLGWWIGQLAAHLQTRGRRTAVWDELLDSDPPEGLLFFGWRDVERAPAARRAGFEAVSCPQKHAYFDWAEGFREGEPLAITGFVPLEKAYAFEPGDVTGVQGQLWTEYLPTPELVEYRAFPRLSALAEVGWSTHHDYGDFLGRLPEHLCLLDSLGVNYRSR